MVCLPCKPIATAASTLWAKANTFYCTSTTTVFFFFSILSDASLTTLPGTVALYVCLKALLFPILYVFFFFSNTRETFSLSLQDSTHTLECCLCVSGGERGRFQNSIIKSAIVALCIESSSERPALHERSTKWQSVLPPLIPHSVISTHLLQSLLGWPFLI